MTDEVIAVTFTIPQGKSDAFLATLQKFDAENDLALGYRVDPTRFARLAGFVGAMDAKLRKNEHKKNWQERPVVALQELMLLEVEKFKIYHEHSTDDARPSLVDLANWAFFLWDRLDDKKGVDGGVRGG